MGINMIEKSDLKDCSNQELTSKFFRAVQDLQECESFSITEHRYNLEVIRAEMLERMDGSYSPHPNAEKK